MKFSIVNITDIDNVTFAWPRRVAPMAVIPAAVELCGTKYQISNFHSKEGSYLFAKVGSWEEAINLSISFYSVVTLAELANIAFLAVRVGADTDKIDIFKTWGIKGRNSINTLCRAGSFPEELLSYMDIRNIPMKILTMLVTFSPEVLGFICGFVSVEKPSIGDFIKFVNNAADFKDIAKKSSYYKGFQFPDRRSTIRIEAENAMKELNESINPVTILSPDFFESGKVSFEFKAASSEEYMNALKALEGGAEKVTDFFRRLKQNDIC